MARDSGDAVVTAIFRSDRGARDSVIVRVRPIFVEIPGPIVIIRKILDHATQSEITSGVLKALIDVEVFWDAPPALGTGQLFVQLSGQNLGSHKFRDTPRSTHICTIDTRPFPNDTARLTALLADTARRYVAAATSRLFEIAN